LHDKPFICTPPYTSTGTENSLPLWLGGTNKAQQAYREQVCGRCERGLRRGTESETGIPIQIAHLALKKPVRDMPETTESAKQFANTQIDELLADYGIKVLNMKPSDFKKRESYKSVAKYLLGLQNKHLLDNSVDLQGGEYECEG
jgi:hypothetical protein